MTKSLAERFRFLEFELSSVLVHGAVLLIRGYQRHISPLLGARCRFYPTCSQYAVLALTEWGFFRGGWLTVKRLARCGPWHEGGYDPPPRKKPRDRI